jgi:hypothetical protein
MKVASDPLLQPMAIIAVLALWLPSPTALRTGQHWRLFISVLVVVDPISVVVRHR